MSEGHWIKLLVKYKGKCAVCGKEIPQGEYALWSRSSKAIKHVQCAEPVSVAAEKEGRVAMQLAPAMQAVSAAPELKCFICGKNAGCPSCSFEQDCNRSVVSQACVCEQCMADQNAYENYQKAFLAKASKLLPKVKM